MIVRSSAEMVDLSCFLISLDLTEALVRMVSPIGVKTLVP
jgi:hypothetical protein